MRRIERENLVPGVENVLLSFQANANALQLAGNLDAIQHWKSKRQSNAVLEALYALKRMAGSRERCMYCVDSLGSDIEHFWPKNPYSNQMYVWQNLLLACTQCGRFKGNEFPLDAVGYPLLIEPSTEDPWDFLDFDPLTGNINARFSFGTQQFSPRGEKTVDVLQLDRREGVSAGYRKTYRRLCDLVNRWIDGHVPDNYVGQLREADDHGILGWFMRSPGDEESAFRRFREEYPEQWRYCQDRFT